MNYEVFYTEKAKDDLSDIYVYVAFTLMEPQIAEKLYGDITGTIRSLENFPERNALVSDEPWRSQGLRKMPVKNYIVFYTVNGEKKRVNIIRIMYSARDIGKELAKLE